MPPCNLLRILCLEASARDPMKDLAFPLESEFAVSEHID